MKLNKKTIIIILIILTIIIFLILGFLYYKNQQIKKLKLEEEQKMLLLEKFEERAKKVREVIIKPQSPKLTGFRYEPLTQEKCDEKQGEEKIKCLDFLKADEASQKDDYNLCKEITDDEIQYYCVMKFVRRDNDIEICEAISEHHWKEACVHYIAFIMNKPELCEYDKEKEVNMYEFERKECMGPLLAYNYAAVGDVEACKKIDILEYSNLCFERIINNFDRDCTKFKKKEDQITCENIILYETALDTKNIALCNLIINETRKKVCINFITIGPDSDADNDGLFDHKELWFNTDPFNSDTDGDGISDGDELKKYHINPLAKDTDGDGLTDGEEKLFNTHPHLKDTDGDGVSDKDYVLEKVNQIDTDNDGLTDIEELEYNADPNNPDTDGDGYSDGDEVKNGYNPNGEGELSN
ncbi:hypothetical protein KAU09_05190 [Candidatus Parcubacteria bacterium]|nr:hypothetical protein [Candidatus Parcubacteria bacterium]